MKSSLDFWQNTPWDPRKELFQKYRVIAMDQRNAGRSVAPVTAEDGWQCYIEDQIGLVDHLGIDKFNVAGMCIGGPYCLGIIDAVPSRVISATIFQTIGLDGNREAFIDYSMSGQMRLVYDKIILVERHLMASGQICLGLIKFFLILMNLFYLPVIPRY